MSKMRRSSMILTAFFCAGDVVIRVRAVRANPNWLLGAAHEQQRAEYHSAVKHDGILGRAKWRVQLV